jgi:hypothetical protein
LLYLRALDHELGDVPVEHLERGHLLIPQEQNSFAVSDVSWDLPIAFVQLVVVAGNDLTSARLQVTMLVNTHPRLDSAVTHPVVAWAHRMKTPDHVV